MASCGSISKTFSQLSVRSQFVAALWLYGVALSQGQIDDSPPENAAPSVELIKSVSQAHIDNPIVSENAPPSVELTKTLPLQKQFVGVKGKDGKVIAYKTSYFGEVQVGSPAQTFTVVFDTGSGHLVLPRNTCYSEACKVHRRYSRAASSSSSDIKYDGSPIDPLAENRDQAKVSFGTGQVSSIFVQDKVCIGSTQPKCVDMRIMTAVEMSEDPFAQFAFDGVMGLGLDAIRLNPQFSFYGQMQSQHHEMLPQFSVFLSHHEDGQSAITFGGHDKSKASTEIEWAPVVMPEHGHWLLQIKQVRIGDSVLEECADGSCRAIADTGTSLLGVPRDASRSMHRFLARPTPTGEGVDMNQINCRNVPGHTIHFDIGDAVVSLPAEVYTRPAPINMTNQNSTGWSLFCRSLLLPVDMPAPVGPKIFILGEPVLRRYLTVYDFEKKRIGFSVARQTDAPVAGAQSIGIPPEGTILDGAPIAAVKPPTNANSPETAVV